MNRVWLKYLPGSLQERLDSRHSLQGIISNSGWLFADKLFRIGVGLSLGIWIARYLGPDNFGLLSYSTAFVSLFTTIATLGLDGIVVRELSIRPEQKYVILGSALALKLGGGLLAYAIALISVLLMRSSSPEVVFLVAVIGGGLIFQAFDVADFWFQSQVQARYGVIARCFAFVLLCAVKVWLLLSHASVYAFAWAAMIEVALAGGALIFAFKMRGNSFAALRVEWPLVRQLLADSWLLAMSGGFVLLTMQLDKIILGEMAGNGAVGIYSVASQISSIWYTVPLIVGASIAPAISRSHALNDPNYATNLQKVYSILAYISVAAAIIVFFLSRPVIGFLFGDEYLAAGPVLAVHVWGALFVFHVSIRTRALIAERKLPFITAIAALTLLSNILLNLILIRRFGILGAAYASLISWCLCATIFPAFWPETRQYVAVFFASFRPHGLK
jgi:PST family polysaccharide transporter